MPCNFMVIISGAAEIMRRTDSHLCLLSIFRHVVVCPIRIVIIALAANYLDRNYRRGMQWETRNRREKEGAESRV